MVCAFGLKKLAFLPQEWLLTPVESQEHHASATADEKQFIDAVTDYVESRINDSVIPVGNLASHMAVSERQLYRTCGELTGLAQAQLVKEIRLKKAYKLLMDKEVSKVAELASRVGYDSAAYFSKQFMERFGKRPGYFLWLLTIGCPTLTAIENDGCRCSAQELDDGSWKWAI